MEYAYQHSQGQRVLRQRNLLAMVALGLAAVIVVLFTISASRDREIVLQPVLQSPLTISSAGVSRQYLELVTRDTSQLILNRSPDNLDYWLTSIVQLCTPQAPMSAINALKLGRLRPRLLATLAAISGVVAFSAMGMATDLAGPSDTKVASLLKTRLILSYSA